MSKIIAILPDELAAEKVTDRLATLNVDNLDWRLLGPDDNPERIFPGFAWPLGSGASTPSGGPVGIPVVANNPQDEEVHNRGVDRDDAEYYGRSIAHGGTAIIIEAASEYEAQIRRILEEADAQQVTVE